MALGRAGRRSLTRLGRAESVTTFTFIFTTLFIFFHFIFEFQVCVIMGTEDPNQLYSTEFEVYGQVQGCNFTKYCKEIAETIGVVGWVKNSKKGTIVGKIQGLKPIMDHMIDWLSTTGSPGCKIEKCDLTNSQQLARLDYHDFTIRF